ncbi:hypothetical protein Tco_1106034 [Tanacetum coccineum]
MKKKTGMIMKRSGGKILVLQEQFSQNQQDFLDEYLPQWDDQLAIHKQESEKERENPFVVKCAQIINKHEEHAFPTAADDAKSSTSYQHLPDAIMGPAVYPKGKGVWVEGRIRSKCVLPTDPGLWSDVISRWESITINRLNSQTWSDNKAKLAFVENLLGESEKLMWQQWRTAYFTLEIIENDPQNITSQDAALAKELRDLSLCSTIPIPGEGDVHQNISIMVQDNPFEEAAFMAIKGINENDDEQSIEEDYYSHHAFMFHPGPPTKIADMVQSAGSWKPDKELPSQRKSYMPRLNCPKCQLTTCALCVRNYLGKTVNVKGKQLHKPVEEKDFNNNEVRLLKELLKEKTEQVQQMIKDQAKEYY